MELDHIVIIVVIIVIVFLIYKDTYDESEHMGSQTESNVKLPIQLEYIKNKIINLIKY